jgi:polysaccharide biosynthesis/export protein
MVASEAEMKRTGERHPLRMRGIGLASISVAIFIGALACASSAQEIQKPQAAADQAGTDTPTSTDKGAAQPSLQLRDPHYQLGAGDTFDLGFPFSPEFNQTVTVQPDGYITLTNLGDQYVAGKTVPELRELLQTAYAKILHDPVINVVPKDFQKPYFIAGGQIGRPGKYDLRGDTTLTEAIAIAGGFTGSSKHSQVLLFRRVSNDWAQVKVLNVKKMFQAGNLTEDVHLQPGDMFFVPQNSISKIKPWVPYTSVSTGFSPTTAF